LIEEALGLWTWGVQLKDKKHLADLLAGLQALKERGVKGAGIIGAYHARRVAPLMARALPLYRMMPGMSFEGTVLVDEALPYSEVAQRVKEATEPTKDSAGGVLDIVYPVPGHPPMRLEPGFFEFVSLLFPCSFFCQYLRISDFLFSGSSGPAEAAFLQRLSCSDAEGSGRGGCESPCG